MIWRALRAVAASVLRVLATLLLRLSRKLDAGHPAVALETVVEPPPDWPPEDLPAPPPHWVELVRERAPELLDGARDGHRPEPQRAARPAPPASARPPLSSGHRIVEVRARAAPSRLAVDWPEDPAPERRADPDLPANPVSEFRAVADFPGNAVSERSAVVAFSRNPPLTRAAARTVQPPAGIGIRVRAQVEELAPDSWRPEPARLTVPATAADHPSRPAPAEAAPEPASRWPELPPSLEPPSGPPELREWERLRALAAEQRGG